MSQRVNHERREGILWDTEDKRTLSVIATPPGLPLPPVSVRNPLHPVTYAPRRDPYNSVSIPVFLVPRSRIDTRVQGVAPGPFSRFFSNFFYVITISFFFFREIFAKFCEKLCKLWRTHARNEQDRKQAARSLPRVSTISTLLMDDESQLLPRRRVNHFERLPRKVVPSIDRGV